MELFNELASPTDVINPENNIRSDEIHEKNYCTTFNNTDLVYEKDSPEFQL